MEVSAVVVDGRLTVCVTADEVLAAKFVVPP